MIILNNASAGSAGTVGTLAQVLSAGNNGSGSSITNLANVTLKKIISTDNANTTVDLTSGNTIFTTNGVQVASIDPSSKAVVVDQAIKFTDAGAAPGAADRWDIGIDFTGTDDFYLHNIPDAGQSITGGDVIRVSRKPVRMILGDGVGTPTSTNAGLYIATTGAPYDIICNGSGSNGVYLGTGSFVTNAAGGGLVLNALNLKINASGGVYQFTNTGQTGYVLKLNYNTGEMTFPVAGSGLTLKDSASAGRTGLATLSSGAATVTTSAVAVGDMILLTRYSAGGSLAYVNVDSVTGATGFTIKSSDNTDSAQVAWFIVKKA